MLPLCHKTSWLVLPQCGRTSPSITLKKRLKQAHYERVTRAVTKVNNEDLADGRAVVPAVWMADHNMVVDRSEDEDKGTYGGREAGGTSLSN